MADLAYQQTAVTGLAASFAAASVGGDTVPVSPRGLLLVTNGDASSKTVTVVVPGTKYGQPLADIPIVVAAGTTAVVGPFPADLDNGNGLVDVTYSAVTSVTVAAVTL